MVFIDDEFGEPSIRRCGQQEPSPAELLASAINKRRSLYNERDRDYRRELLLKGMIQSLCKHLGESRAARRRRRNRKRRNSHHLSHHRTPDENDETNDEGSTDKRPKWNRESEFTGHGSCHASDPMAAEVRVATEPCAVQTDPRPPTPMEIDKANVISAGTYSSICHHPSSYDIDHDPFGLDDLFGQMLGSPAVDPVRG